MCWETVSYLVFLRRIHQRPTATRAAMTATATTMPAMPPDDMPLFFALSEVVGATTEPASAEAEGEVEEKVGDAEIDVIVDPIDDSEATDCNEADD